MPRPHNAVVSLEELTVHGWDLARATGQEYAVSDEDLDVLDRFFEIFGEAPFGPPADTPDGATRFEAMLAATGRDPGWHPEG